MIEDSERSVLNPMAGDVWELSGNPELIVLSVDEKTIEYCNKKVHLTPGVWKWDLVQYQTVPKKHLRNLVYHSVSLGEEAIDFRLHISPTILALGIVEEHMNLRGRNMDSHPDQYDENDKWEIIEHSGYTIKFDPTNLSAFCLLENNGREFEIPLEVLWELSERTGEAGAALHKARLFNRGE